MDSSNDIRYKADFRATEFPSVTLSANLKQIDIPRLGAKQRELLNLCFPKFEQIAAVNAAVVAQGSSTVVTRRGTYDITQGRQRRYSGGADLPAGRYYAVCNDKNGDDGGTVCYELSSYWNADTGVFPFLTDSTVHPAAAKILIERNPQLLDVQGPCLIVAHCDIDQVVLTEEGGFATKNGDAFFSALPLRVSRIICDNVLDLRLPASQDWLVDLCKMNQDPRRRVSDANGVVTFEFHDLLANLVSPYPGGTVFDQSIGAWLQAHGCQGLVYPSARRNFHSVATDDAVIISDGWNFVLFGGGSSGRGEPEIQLPFPWLSWREIGAQLYRNREGAPRSWRVDGVERCEWRRIRYEVRRALSNRQKSVSFNDYYESRNLHGRLSYLFEP